MKIKLKDLDINYVQYGEGKDIVLLHGWGQNIEMMKFLGDRFCEDYRITILDFPGYGESPEPSSAWFISDYCELVHDLIVKLKIDNPILIGHSFGGRVAIKYASLYDVSKLVLFGAPCIRKNKELDAKTKFLKWAKTLPGMNASPIMRQVLVNTVNEDLSEDAKKIKCPTLLIWGTNDTEAPIEDARELEKLLSDGALIELSGTHYAYIENLNQVTNILYNFF